MLAQKHFRETENILRGIPEKTVALWFLNEGFFPEQNILPPSFKVSDFELQKQPYKNLSNLKNSTTLEKLSYPKTHLTSRHFAIQHPKYYHDIVFHIAQNWSFVLDHLFNESNKFYSYSLPIPISKSMKDGLSKLRSGRMIYEWIEMAENHLVIDSVSYKYVVRTDITNFYPSVYTHSIGWALHGREKSFKDKNYELLGNKIDRLIQYSNEARTNGIPIGSALSDFIAELMLIGIDTQISNDLGDKDFLGLRFKDDYRILCNSRKDAEFILKTIANYHSEYNLSINENKTQILELPKGLYRPHNRHYFQYSLRDKRDINFKVFEYTLLETLDIHNRYPGTSILDKFLNELLTTRKRELKIRFSRFRNEREKQIKKAISLLFLLKRESEKTICHVLSVIEQLFVMYRQDFPDLKVYLQSIVIREFKNASEKESLFQVLWLIFFSKYVGLGIDKKQFADACSNEGIKNNNLYKTMLESKQKIFMDSGITLFRTPKKCRDIESIAKHLSIFAT